MGRLNGSQMHSPSPTTAASRLHRPVNKQLLLSQAYYRGRYLEDLFKNLFLPRIGLAFSKASIVVMINSRLGDELTS